MHEQKSVLQILKRGVGDQKLVIETEADIAEANALIKDMTKKGYLVVTEAGEKITGVSTTGTFIIKTGPKTEDTKEVAPGTKGTAAAPVAGG